MSNVRTAAVLPLLCDLALSCLLFSVLLSLPINAAIGIHCDIALCAVSLTASASRFARVILRRGHADLPYRMLERRTRRGVHLRATPRKTNASMRGR